MISSPSLRSFRIIGAEPKFCCLLGGAGKCRSAGLRLFVICILHLKNRFLYIYIYILFIYICKLMTYLTLVVVCVHIYI